MAESVHLFLKANGQEIKGESSQVSLGREGSIECFSFDLRTTQGRDPNTGLGAGRRQYAPLVFRKRIDKASPALMKAFAENQALDGAFKFYRPAPSGDGTTQQFYTIEVKQARITSIAQLLPDMLDTRDLDKPPFEEVSLTFRSIKWTYTDGGLTYEDTVIPGRL